MVGSILMASVCPDAAEGQRCPVFDRWPVGDVSSRASRIYGGNVFRLDEHLERLELSAKAIVLNVPLDQPAMAEAVCENPPAKQSPGWLHPPRITRGVGDPRPGTLAVRTAVALHHREQISCIRRNTMTTA